MSPRELTGWTRFRSTGIRASRARAATRGSCARCRRAARPRSASSARFGAGSTPPIRPTPHERARRRLAGPTGRSPEELGRRRLEPPRIAEGRAAYAERLQDGHADVVHLTLVVAQDAAARVAEVLPADERQRDVVVLVVLRRFVEQEDQRVVEH